MKVLFDTNVVLDVLLDREPHIAAKSFRRRRAHSQVRELLTLFEVPPVDRGVLDRALDLDFTDFEDAVLHEAARDYGAAAIVTRDAATFVHATLPILDPRELLTAVAAAAQ